MTRTRRLHREFCGQRLQGGALSALKTPTNPPAPTKLVPLGRPREEVPMRVQYPEGPRSLTIAAVGVTAKRGEPVEVPDDVGEQLLQQGWRKASAPTKPAPTAATPPNTVKKETK